MTRKMFNSTSEQLKHLIARKKVNDTNLEEGSKIRLKENMERRIKTTMIGALDAIEKTFGHLWNEGSSEEERYMAELFKKVRGAILDIGNNQIRDTMLELDQYQVEWNGRYTVVLPVMKKEG